MWANFEFTAPSGALFEVDALAITDNGVHQIEIKSHPGHIGGDGTTWQWTIPEGRRRPMDNPRLLANRKANALRELLNRSKAFAHHRGDVPYVSEAVLLSDPDHEVRLSEPGRHQVFGRDPDPGQVIPAWRTSIGGIIEALTSLDPAIGPGGGRTSRRGGRPRGGTAR